MQIWPVSGHWPAGALASQPCKVRFLAANCLEIRIDTAESPIRPIRTSAHAPAVSVKRSKRRHGCKGAYGRTQEIRLGKRASLPVWDDRKPPHVPTPLQPRRKHDLRIATRELQRRFARNTQPEPDALTRKVAFRLPNIDRYRRRRWRYERRTRTTLPEARPQAFDRTATKSKTTHGDASRS